MLFISTPAVRRPMPTGDSAALQAPNDPLAAGPTAAAARLAQMRAQPQRPTSPVPHENYAGADAERHARCDGGYTQKDVIDVARALTGWTIDGRSRAAASCSRRRCTTRAKPFSASGSAGCGEDVRSVPDLLASIRRRRIKVRSNSRSVSCRTNPRPRSWIGGQNLPRHEGHLRGGARSSLPEFPRRSQSREGKTLITFGVGGLRVRRDRRNTMPLIQQLRARHAAYGRQPPTGTAIPQTCQ